MSDTFTGETYNTLCMDAEGYLAKDSPEQARELLKKAISLIATRPRARSILADTCMSMELWAEARSQLEVLLTLDEGNRANNFKLAQVLEELGEYQLAMDNYTVVLDDEPDHHGAVVAVKRIETRTKDSWINLTDIFEKRQTDVLVETGSDKEADEFRDGMQVFPDVPSEGLFADSEDEETNVERLLKNIGLSGDSVEELEDASELLENIGVSTSETLQAAFADSEDITDVEDEQKQSVTSLDEIFGTPSVVEETVTETVREPEELEEEKEEASPVPESIEKDEDEPFSFHTGKTLEAIFNTPEPQEPAAEEVVEPEPEEPAAEEVVEPEPEEPAAEEVIEPEPEEPAAEEVVEPEADKPGEDEKITAVLKQEADLSIDSWSRESGLLTVHIKSGIACVKHDMLTIYEKTLKVERSEDDVLELSGAGTFLLNCGAEEPLILELIENMVIRKDAVAFHTGSIAVELLDIPENDSFYVIKEKVSEKVIFLTDHPVRIILLGGSSRVFYVRTSSIAATDPEILLSISGSPDGYTEITGSGKVYLIE
ncbi:hypothetical protein DRQ25_05500 [Candidatus Fermentibacteria bacterium]|nr:MAG: hypothetical protein DRQ25_05500 [Candidatus Fermentibacteria bacterium]